MVEIPYRLQGTDGIRGRIADDADLKGSTALEFFLESGFLTPSFFEVYAYAYASLLLKSGAGVEGGSIVVGWDPRDSKGVFNRAAIRGIRKAGLDVVEVGMLPTPAVPLYMLAVKAEGSMVLTASHNPSDQNGIKLFHGFTALKFLPTDDQALTEMIETLHIVDLGGIVAKGGLADHAVRARELFVSFCCDPLNSWITDEDFSDTVLVVDASKGAVSGVVEEIFSAYSFKDIVFANLEGGINESCGVADLEGMESIPGGDVLPADSTFHSYQALKTMFEKSRTVADIGTGRTKLVGLVFDGDGDRCYRLDYRPERDELLVSSGDLLGVHQAKYLKERGDWKENEAWFINTVESDLNTALTAGEMGYEPVITGVGDKWILLKAVLDMIHSAVDPGSEPGREIAAYLSETDKNREISGLKLSRLWKDYTLSGIEENPESNYRFRIGIEESGHCITPGFLKRGSETVRCYAGNGIKAALNSLTAIKTNYLRNTEDDWFDAISQPFAAGIRYTAYVYYVDKSRMMPGSDLRTKLKSVLTSLIEQTFPEEYSAEFVEFPEEDSMLYCRVLKDRKMCGALFIRNSGTEDKSALYLRGRSQISAYLDQIASHLHLFLLKELKNTENDFAKFEKKLLFALEQGESVRALSEEYPSLPVDRIIKEVEMKENLIVRRQGGLMLTEKGKLLIEYWK
ncbi:MAG: hypothetical protein GY866_02435 [Proteobacteria bacterium]|nr:hypothetical protein [Pseudomonadota bacterium]